MAMNFKINPQYRCYQGGFEYLKERFGFMPAYKALRVSLKHSGIYLL